MVESGQHRLNFMVFSGKVALLIFLSGTFVTAGSSATVSSQQVAPSRVNPGSQPAKAVALHSSKSKTKTKIAQPQPPAPQPEPVPYTPPPVRPAQMPAVAPRISYQNGQLTVIAENSNLSDVLNGIRTATGVRIENSGGSGGDRVAAKIGPAPVRDVLLSLLQGSRYDFVMMGSDTDPNQIERVVLSQKSAATGGNNPAPAQASTLPQNGVVQSEETDSEGEDNNNEGFAPAPAQPAPQTNQPQPPGAAVQPGSEPANGVKTPEQLLQDLRNMEQQRLQQQQQQQQQQAQPPGSPDQPRPPRTSRPQ
jgi:hypothetical protein